MECFDDLQAFGSDTSREMLLEKLEREVTTRAPLLLYNIYLKLHRPLRGDATEHGNVHPMLRATPRYEPNS